MAMTDQEARNRVINAVARARRSQDRARTRRALRASVSLDDLQTLLAAATTLVTLGDVKHDA